MQDVKARSRRLTELVESCTDAYSTEVGAVQRVCVVERAAKAGHLVAHNDSYTQVLLDDQPGLLGSVVDVRITRAARWSVFGEVLFMVHRCPEPPAEAAGAALRARARVTTVLPRGEGRGDGEDEARGGSGGTSAGSASSEGSCAGTSAPSAASAAAPRGGGGVRGYCLQQLQRGAAGWGLDGTDLMLAAALGAGLVGLAVAGAKQYRAGVR